MVRLGIAKLALALLFPVLSVPAFAQESEQDRFFIRVNAFLPDMETTARIDPNNAALPGTEVNFESDLGLDERPVVPSIEARARLSRKWRVQFEYLTIGRSRTAILDRALRIGDTTYDVDAELSANFGTDLYKVQVGWSPLRTDSAELGVTLGAHVTVFEVGFEGVGTVNGVGGTVRQETREVTAPLPNIGAYGAYELTDDLWLHGRVHWLKLSVGDYTGRLLDAEAAIEWRALRNVGIGGGFRVLDYGLDIEKERFTGRIGYRFSGPIVFLSARF